MKLLLLIQFTDFDLILASRKVLHFKIGSWPRSSTSTMTAMEVIIVVE